MHRLKSMVLPIARHLGGDDEDTVREIHTTLLFCTGNYIPALRHNLQLFQNGEAETAKIMKRVDDRELEWSQVTNEISFLSHVIKLAQYDAMFTVYHIQDVCRAARSKLNLILPVNTAYITALRNGTVEKVEAVDNLTEAAVPDYRGLRDAIAHEGQRYTNFDKNAAPVNIMGINTGDMSIGLNGQRSGNTIAFNHKNRTLTFELNETLPESMESVVKSVLDFMQPYSDLHDLDTGFGAPNHTLP